MEIHYSFGGGNFAITQLGVKVCEADFHETLTKEGPSISLENEVAEITGSRLSLFRLLLGSYISNVTKNKVSLI